MQLKIKATATALEQGVFTAVISSASVDLEGDVISPVAMLKAFEKWAGVDKLIPLTWNHSGNPEDIIGNVNPATAKIIGAEVHIDGWIDQATRKGVEAWRLVKSGTLGFSYGAMIPNNGYVKNAHGGMDVHEMDIFEATATPTPMNRDTRVASWKGMVAKALDSEDAGTLGEMLELAAAYIEDQDEPDERANVTKMEGVITVLSELLQFEVAETEPAETDDLAAPAGAMKSVEGQTDAHTRTVDPLRKQADRVALEVAKGGPLPIGRPEPTPEPPVLMELDALKRKSRDLMLQVLSGVEL